MSDKLHLLTLPLEVRCHIYSYIYLEGRIVEFLCPKSHYTKTALFLSCRRLHRETLEYYYAKNTFSIPLRKRFAVSEWRFLPRHFDLVKMLYLEAETFFWKFSGNNVKTAEHTKSCQRRLEKYLSAILWVNRGMSAPKLKTLIFADSVPTIGSSVLGKRSTETSKERLKGYLKVFEQLNIGVGQAVVKFDQEDTSRTDDESDMLDLLSP